MGAIGGEGMWGGDGGGESQTKVEGAEDAATKPSVSAAPPAPAPKKGGKEKKESATVRAARERMEAQAKLDEERRIFEEAENKRIADEEAKIAAEEAALAAERQRKRDLRAAKIQKQKDEGTYLTKQQKLKQARAAQLREQFGFNMEDEKEDDEDAE